jgi:DNA replication and repair protein RecF
LMEVYAKIAEVDEGPEFEYRMNADCTDVESVSRLLYDSRKRDSILGSTQRGPHRDDLHFSLSIGGAKEYASDGQQRGLCVALRIAQARLLQETLGLTPILLVDDVLGELDPHRQAGFWRTCPPEIQIIATGTILPKSSEAWRVWDVANGQFKLRSE